MTLSGAEIALIIGNLATLVTAIGGFVILVRRTDTVKEHVKRVEHATNGLSERLGAAKLAQGVAEGKAQGLEQGRGENAGTQ